jgi:hypothetical protein
MALLIGTARMEAYLTLQNLTYWVKCDISNLVAPPVGESYSLCPPDALNVLQMLSIGHVWN